MLVLRTSASPIPATMIPPGPGRTPTSGETINRIAPVANSVHSTAGLSRILRHRSRPMDEDVVTPGRSRKPLAVKVYAGLALLRRARGKSEQSWTLQGRGLMAATVATVAYLGLEARAVEVQVQLSSGLPAFIIV